MTRLHCPDGVPDDIDALPLVPLIDEDKFIDLSGCTWVGELVQRGDATPTLDRLAELYGDAQTRDPWPDEDRYHGLWTDDDLGDLSGLARIVLVVAALAVSALIVVVALVS